jgi:hypothetical protein
MLGPLAVIVIVLTSLDHFTTWLCLNQPVEGWSVTEANPLSDFLFSEFGLAQGLALDSAVTLALLLMLVRTDLLSRRAKVASLVLLMATTGYAVVNNLQAVRALGLWPGGVS